MTISSKRAEYAALTSFLISIVFFFITFFLGKWSGFYPVYESSFFVLSSVFISLVLVIQFHQRSLAERERLDLSHLESDKASSAIFQSKEETATLFAVAQKRLAIFEKWFLPIISALIAVYQLAIGLYLFKIVWAGEETVESQTHALVCAVCMAAIAFVSFLISRYSAGMSTTIEWKPLRSAGSFLLGIAVLCFILAISLAFAHFKFFMLINIVAWIPPVLLLMLGAETSLNVILDIYRPHLKDQYSKAAFDSRLLGIISEPGEILHTAASAIDYQFGFKVSQTWFYKLLEKTIIPLALFGALTLYLLSCIVVVQSNEEAIIEHFGNPLTSSGQPRIIGPGLALKWPWPIDIAYRYPTKKISEISIGYVPKIDPNTGQPERGPKLWGQSHYEKEYDLIVAGEHSTLDQNGAVPISLIKANLPVQYRVKDLYSFLYNYGTTKKRGQQRQYEAEKVFEAICYHHLTQFAASAKIEVENNKERSLLGAGRFKAKEYLTSAIQKAADKLGLGIEVVFIGVQGIHPPADVAADYERVVGAVQKKQAAILTAQGQSNRDLSNLAGSTENANKLYYLAEKYQKALGHSDTSQTDQLGTELDSVFSQASGDIFNILKKSQSYAFEKSTLAYATGLRFADQLKAYKAAPNIYKRQQRLIVLEESMQNIRKYVIAADTNNTEVFIVDLQEKLTPDLYDLAGLQQENKK